MIGVTSPLLPSFVYINLRPGEMVITAQPAIITTLLGSCISICLYHPAKKTGGMCHCLLPSNRGTNRYKSPYNFVNDTISHMIEVMVNDHGIHLPEIKVKLFGGANVLPTGKPPGKEGDSIGEQNILTARSVIRRYGLEITSQRVGGEHGYKLFFNTQTGEVFLRFVTNRNAENPVESGRGK